MGNGFYAFPSSVGTNVVATTTDPNFADPGVPGTIVSGSSWYSTGYLAIGLAGGTLVIQSPVPTASQRVVITWFDWVAVLTANLAAFNSSNPVIRETPTPANLLWQFSFGFVGTAKAGEDARFETSRHVLVGRTGVQVELAIPVSPLASINIAANMGGYLVAV